MAGRRQRYALLTPRIAGHNPRVSTSSMQQTAERQPTQGLVGATAPIAPNAGIAPMVAEPIVVGSAVGAPLLAVIRGARTLARHSAAAVRVRRLGPRAPAAGTAVVRQDWRLVRRGCNELAGLVVPDVCPAPPTGWRVRWLVQSRGDQGTSARLEGGGRGDGACWVVCPRPLATSGHRQLVRCRGE
jgi:hypothetical protein